MENLSKLCLTFSKTYKNQHEFNYFYIKRIIKEAQEYAAYYNADVLEIKGLMSKADIRHFKKILDNSPISKELIGNHIYYVTFMISVERLLNKDLDSFKRIIHSIKNFFKFSNS